MLVIFAFHTNKIFDKLNKISMVDNDEQLVFTFSKPLLCSFRYGNHQVCNSSLDFTDFDIDRAISVNCYTFLR